MQRERMTELRKISSALMIMILILEQKNLGLRKLGIDAT
jgi:hypothetical protein